MSLPENITSWTLLVLGSGMSLGGMYYVGKANLLAKLKNDHPVWVAVADHGVFGFEPIETFRTRPAAESFRRSVTADDYAVEVWRMDDWKLTMHTRIASRGYWEGLEGAFAKLNQAPAITEVLSLPIEPPAEDRIDAILSGVAALISRVGTLEEIISDSVRSIDGVRGRLVELEHELAEHAGKAGHMTAELAIIVEDGNAEALRSDPTTKEFPRPTGGTLVRSTRGLEPIGKLASDRSDH